MRAYDPRIGKFLSVDPLMKSYPELTPYQYANNTPIQAIDLDGEENKYYLISFNEKTGKSQVTLTKEEWTLFGEHPYWNYKGNEYYFGDEAPGWMKRLGVGSVTANAMEQFSGKTEAELDQSLGSKQTTAQVAMQREAEHEKEIVSLFQDGFTVAWAVRRANTPTTSVNKQITAAQGGNKAATKTGAKASEDKWANFDFEEYQTVYHKGNLSGGKVSTTRLLSTGTDRAAVNSIREGTLYEFKIPKNVYNDWTRRGLASTWQDYDYVTGVRNEEIRFDPKVADDLNKYMIK
ncbi:hypothetical protein CTE07_09330 [Chitinophaga terrae (ex Kim and Jung 2007)]|nr:hypothetical protein CTE07_09330 [Chitinophaga terrae (ex Kim and Jung 2007)]